MASYFCPDDWQMSAELRRWTLSKGLTDAQVDEQLESFRDHQYKRPMKRWDACWRNWIKNAIKWGDVTPVAAPRYRTTSELSEEQRKADAAKAWQEMNRLRGVK